MEFCNIQQLVSVTCTEVHRPIQVQILLTDKMKDTSTIST